MNQLVASRRAPARTGAVALLTFLLVLLSTSTQALAAGNAQKVTTGTLSWGVKKSFREYMTGFIAGGTIKATDKARLDSSNVATFVDGTGTVRDGVAEISYKGAVHYYGHAGELDFILSDPKLTLDAKGTGHLELGYAVGKNKAKRVVMADVDAATLAGSGTKVSATNVKTHLTKAGMTVFSYKGNSFYPEKTELDPLSTNVVLATPTTTTPTNPTPTTTAPSPSTPKPSPTTTTPAPAKPATQPATSAPAGTSALSWGLKSSFRSYIAGGIAHGRITVSQHASASSAGFTFPQRSTNAHPPSGAGSTQYTGAVNFYGHDGILDVTLSNPRVVVPSSGSAGQLFVDYADHGKSKGSVQIASLDLGRGQKSASSSSVSYRGVPATLTQQGTAIFSYQGHGFYPAGTVLDPASFTIGANAKVTGSGSGSVVTGTVAAPSGSSSSSTPASPAGGADVSTPAPATAASGEGALVWGVRSSFRSYILGPIAHGAISVSGGAAGVNGGWSFPQNGAKSSDGGASYRGTVHFTGHSGILDLTFANPTVRITSGSSATLSVTVNGKTSDMVTLDLSRASKSSSEGATTYTGAPAKLTSSGAKVFSYQGRAFYPAGSTMDPVTFTVGANSKAQGAASTTSSTSTGLPGSVSTTSKNGSAPGSTSATLPETTCKASGTDLSWGFKESFRSYIKSSITNGDWTTAGGASYRIPAFVWPEGDGRFGKDGKQGEVTFPGSVHFTGHDGALDTTISNPRVEITGDKAYLRLDVKSTVMDAALKGQTQWYTRENVRFAELDMSRISAAAKDGKTTITAKNVGAKLTSDGSSAFPNYTAGSTMDPLSFTVTTTGDCVKNKAAAPSASSAAKPSSSKPTQQNVTDPKKDGGSNALLPWLGGGALALVGIGSGAAIARGRGAKATAGTHGVDGGEQA